MSKSISITNGITIYQYTLDKSTLVNTFISARKAGKFFNCSHTTIKGYCLNGKLFKNEWTLFTSKK